VVVKLESEKSTNYLPRKLGIWNQVGKNILIIGDVKQEREEQTDNINEDSRSSDSKNTEE
jgi:hypothetical protein